MVNMHGIITTTVILVLARHVNAAANGPVCLTCDDVPNPADCNRVAQCGVHEECSMEQFLSSTGHLRYKLGCKDTAYCGGVSVAGMTVLCSQCCDTDLCTASLCGAAGFPRTHGPICYHCEFPVSSVLDCDKIKVCGRDETCGVTGVVGGKYDVKCRSVPECTIIRENAICGDCCPDQLCNTRCASHGCDDDQSCSGHRATLAVKGQDICSIANMKTLCNKTCGLCPNSPTQAPITPASTASPSAMTPICADEAQCPILVSTFHTSGIDVCQSGARYACNVTCSLCPGTSTTKPTTKPLTSTGPTSSLMSTAPAGSCKDNIDDCATLGKAHCHDDFREFAQKNCQKYCDLCAPNVDPTPTSTSGTPLYGCYDKGQRYAQGETWHEGCVQSCTCTDGNLGLYSCRARCIDWNSGRLSSSCHMDPPPPGLCCEQPRCPAYIRIQVPSSYKDQYPGYQYV